MDGRTLGRGVENMASYFRRAAEEEAPVSNSPDFTAEEITAFKETKALLLKKGIAPSKINTRELLLCVINCKLRPEKASSKYEK